jgi:FtsH-binding integral membrane protein
MPEDHDSAVPSSTHRAIDCRNRRAIEISMRQIMLGIYALFLLLLIGFGALSYVIAVNEHYETTGAFIDLLFRIANLYAALLLVALLLMSWFVFKSGIPAQTPEQ